MVRRQQNRVNAVRHMENNVTRLPQAETLRPIVALVAHDRRKDEMVEWATFNRGTLSRCTIYATRTTGLTLQTALETPIQLMLSGPMGGDAQLGSRIAEGRIGAVFFFWAPLTPQPHDVDVKALLRLAVLYDVRLRGGGVPEEEPGVDAPFGDHRAELGVSTHRSREHQLDRRFERCLERQPGRPGSVDGAAG